MSSKATFIPATSEQVAYIRKQLGTTERDIQEAVRSLREWLEMQPHLPTNIDDDRIERMYINCKCSMERTKLGLDAYFSLKHRLPELLMNRDPLAPEILEARDNVKMLVMPKLTKEGYRVIINTDVSPDASKYNYQVHAKMVCMEIELMLKEDYSLGDIMIFNLENASTGHVLRTDINSIRGSEILYKTAYCRRLKGLHLVNAPKMVDTIMMLVKSALSEKLRKRVHAHLPGSATLFDHVAREYVPNELGGTAGPIDTFSYQYFNKTIELRDWFLEQDKYLSDENKRPLDNKYSQDIYGVAGSFKKLNVD